MRCTQEEPNNRNTQKLAPPNLVKEGISPPPLLCAALPDQPKTSSARRVSVVFEHPPRYLDVAHGQRPVKEEAVDGLHSTQRHVRLADLEALLSNDMKKCRISASGSQGGMSKTTRLPHLGDVDHSPRQRRPLALVHGRRPGEAERYLPPHQRARSAVGIVPHGLDAG